MDKWYYKYSSKDGSTHTGSCEFDGLTAAKKHVQSLPDFDSLNYVALTPLDDSSSPSTHLANSESKEKEAEKNAKKGDEYLLESQGQQRGPYTLNQIKSMWSNGLITSDSICWLVDSSERSLVKDLVEKKREVRSDMSTRSEKWASIRKQTPRQNRTSKKSGNAWVFVVIIIGVVLLFNKIFFGEGGKPSQEDLKKAGEQIRKMEDEIYDLERASIMADDKHEQFKLKLKAEQRRSELKGLLEMFKKEGYEWRVPVN
jgi:hypothetical protein